MSCNKCPVCGKEVSPFTRIHCGRPLPITQSTPENSRESAQENSENKAKPTLLSRLDYALIQLRTSPEKRTKLLTIYCIIAVIFLVIYTIYMLVSSWSPYKCVVCNKSLTDANVYSYNQQAYCYLCRLEVEDGVMVEPRCSQCGETARYHNEDYTECHCEDCWNRLVENGKIVIVTQ